LSVEKGPDSKPYRVLWPGHSIRQGTVLSVVGDLIKVNTGETTPSLSVGTRSHGEGNFCSKKRGSASTCHE
jgi:hypothetical protein